MDDAAVITSSHEAPAAFEAIFERHFAVVHRYLRRREERRWRAYARAHAIERPPLPDLDGRLDAQTAVGAALATLSADQRAVLLLTAWAELSGDEIALALGIPAATVRSRLGRARARLQTLPALQALAPASPSGCHPRAAAAPTTTETTR